MLYVYVTDHVSNDDSMQDSVYKLQINGKNVNGAIEGGEYKVFDMKPDTILVTAVRRNIEEQNLKLSMQAGNVYFLKIQSSSFGGQFTFDQVSSSEGKSDIAKTALAGASGVDLTAYTPDFGGSTAGDNENNYPTMTEDQINAIIEKKLSAMQTTTPVKTVQTKQAKPTFTSTPKLSKMDEIQRAFEMKEKGMLTHEEFTTIKAEILAK